MKRVALLLYLYTSLFGADRLIVGGGPYLQTQPYKGADPVALFSPVIFYNETPFYVRWTRVGVYVLGEQGEEASWGASLTLEPMILGDYAAATLTDLYPRKKTAVLAGLEERPSSWEGGLALGAQRGDLYGEVMVLQDVLGRNNALRVQGEVGYGWHFGSWYLLPGVVATWLSQPFTDYYYGVRPHEADLPLGRSAYRPDAAFNVAVQTYVKYDFSPRWSLFAFLRADRFDDTVTDSPLIGRGSMFSGIVALLYTIDLSH